MNRDLPMVVHGLRYNRVMLRVLAIDDDPGTRRILEVFLKSKGADVVTSDFPGDIADLIAQAHPDVLLLDLVASSEDLDGLVILGKLRANPQTTSLPVLLMSANHVWLSGLAVRLRDLGVGVIPKPFDFERLWQTVEQAAVGSHPCA
jgi:two-component system KDP operon response regulator KdpE